MEVPLAKSDHDDVAHDAGDVEDVTPGAAALDDNGCYLQIALRQIGDPLTRRGNSRRLCVCAVGMAKGSLIARASSGMISAVICVKAQSRRQS